MDFNSLDTAPESDPASGAGGVLIVPYQWIGDFVRIHSVVKLLKSQNKDTPIDVLATTNNAALLDYMPGVRKGIVADLPRKRLALRRHLALGKRLRAERYQRALIMPRTWKAALAPLFGGVRQRSGFIGEWRFGLINDLRFGEKALPRMIDQCAALTLSSGASLPSEWPMPELKVPPPELAAWRTRMQLPDNGRPVVALAPGAVGPSKRWQVEDYRAVAMALERDGIDVWVVGGPGERSLAKEICAGNNGAHDLTGTDLRNAILALAAASAAVSNDSGLLHVAAALGTPSIGIFGPTSPWHWAPLNPLAAIVQTDKPLACQPCHLPVCKEGHHLCMREISAARVITLIRAALENPAARVVPLPAA